MIMESFTVKSRPSGATVFEATSNGVVASAPTRFMQDSAVLHESMIVVVDVLAASVDRPVFTPVRGGWVLAGCSYTNRVAGTDAGAVTADIMACDPGEAPSAGVTQLSAANAINLKAAVDTPVSVALAATPAEVGAGGYFALNVTGVLTVVVSQITCEFKRVH